MMKKSISCVVLLGLFGCTSNNINPVTTHYIYMSTDKAPTDCKYKGMIYGGHITSTNGNFKLSKNVSGLHITQAKKLGANYIEMNPSIDGGKAYSCPDSELTKMDSYK